MNPRDPDDDRNLKPFPGPSHRNRTPYKFNQEELKVLRECNRESFFQRCLPLGALMGLGTYYGVQTGLFKPNAKYGATPKVVVAVIVGYFLGKLSYQGKCAEKFMQLPDSQIGELLRQKRKGILQENVDTGFGPSVSLAPFSSFGSSDVYSDVDSRTGMDLDTTRPEIEGLDDSHRPTIDNPIYEEEMPPVQKKTTTYEELRKQNREEYQQKRVPDYRSPAQSTPAQSKLSTPGESAASTFDVPKVRTNKYGDAME